jgi:hypothetical protein
MTLMAEHLKISKEEAEARFSDLTSDAAYDELTAIADQNT